MESSEKSCKCQGEGREEARETEKEKREKMMSSYDPLGARTHKFSGFRRVRLLLYIQFIFIVRILYEFYKQQMVV